MRKLWNQIRNTPRQMIVLTSGVTVLIFGVLLSILFATGVINIKNNETTANTSHDSTNGSSSLTVNNAQQAPPTCSAYNAITSRGWLQIAKNPDSHTGDCIIVYGEVTQFDSATGDNIFRADVGGVKLTPDYGYVDYPTNTVLIGDASGLKDVVEGDLFTANATVMGSQTYDTQIGGQTTTPELEVDSINVTGHLTN